MTSRQGQDGQDRENDHDAEGQTQPTQPPPKHFEGRREVGDKGQEQGSELPRGEGREDGGTSNADRAKENERRAIDRGHETPA